MSRSASFWHNFLADFHNYHVCMNHHQSLFKSVRAKSKTVLLRLGPCLMFMCTLQSVVKLASKELALLLPNKFPAQK